LDVSVAFFCVLLAVGDVLSLRGLTDGFRDVTFCGCFILAVLGGEVEVMWHIER
jgi:hypothetical protein